MRRMGLILAVMAIGWAGVVSGYPPCGGQPCGGQACCQECGGYSMGWGPLSGEACCSPPGFAMGLYNGPVCCWANQHPCCNNAWDGYCAHHAKVQAWLTQVGVPKYRCCPCNMPRGQTQGCVVCYQCAAPMGQPPCSIAAPAAAPSPR